MKRYVLMCDYGLDDAVATVYFLNNRAPGSLVDIMPVGGNCDVTVSHRNAQTLLAHYDGDKTGVRIIDTRSVRQNGSSLPSIHGVDSMGDVLEVKTSDLPVISYAEWLAESAPLYLISLGPCTLTLEILQKRVVDDLLIMGGNVGEVPNFNGYEFNHAMDIPAFNACVRYPHVAATLDTCRTPRFNYIDRVQPGNTLLERLINAAIRLAYARHPDNSYIYDFITLHYLFESETFTVVPTTDKDGNKINMLKSKF